MERWQCISKGRRKIDEDWMWDKTHIHCSERTEAFDVHLGNLLGVVFLKTPFQDQRAMILNNRT